MLFFMLINIKMVRGAQSPLGLFAQLPQRGYFAQLPLGFSASLLLNLRKGLNASLLLMPQGHFISFARTKETKQRKFAVCTFCATPASVSAKQKELADAQTAFCF